MYARTIIIAVFCVSAASALALQSSVPFINADNVHAQGITGNGVTVAVIDTGIDYGEPGLAGSIESGGVSIINGVEVPDGGEDIWPQYSGRHGTYMSLIITDQMGVAHDAGILPIRVFHVYCDNNQCVYTALPEDIVDAIRYVINRRSIDPSIRVINLSLGGGGGSFSCSCDSASAETAAFQAAISDALAAGIISFVATGNDAACGGISAPACVSSAVRVAASYDAHYPTTDFGDCGDFSPPAYWITCFTNIAENCNYLLAAPGYKITVGGFQGDGTSQATAHCSGVAALMFDKSGCGGLDAYLARTILFNTASTYDWAYPKCPLPPEPKHINALAAVNDVTAGPCPAVAVDLDCDNMIGPSDFQKFMVCMTGAGGGPTTGGCRCADFPESPPDGDVDLRDFIHFQRLYSGDTGSTATVTLNLTSPSAGQIVEPGATISWSVAATVSQGNNAGLAAISVDLVQDAGNPRFFDLPPATIVGSGMEGFNLPAGISNPATEFIASGYGGTPLGAAGAKNLRQIGGAQNIFGEKGNTDMGADFTVDTQVGQTGSQVIAAGSFTAPTRQGTYVFRIENGLANVLHSINPPPTPPASWPVSTANVTLNSSSFTIVIPYNLVIFDFDGDGDVDMDDFGIMQRCYTGPIDTVSGSCTEKDVTGDTHVNTYTWSSIYGDIDLMHHCMSGAGVPADPLCADCNGNDIHDANPADPSSGDPDLDGVYVRGRPACPVPGNDCDDNCPCVANNNQLDTDGDGKGDACDSTPFGPSAPEAPGGGEGMMAGPAGGEDTFAAFDGESGSSEGGESGFGPEGGGGDSPPVTGLLNITPTPTVQFIQLTPGSIFSVDLRVQTLGTEVGGVQTDLIASVPGVFAVVGPEPLGPPNGNPAYLNHPAFNDNDPVDPVGYDPDDPLGLWASNATAAGIAFALPAGLIPSLGSLGNPDPPSGPFATAREGDALILGSSRLMSLQLAIPNDPGLIGQAFQLNVHGFMSFTAVGQENASTAGAPLTVEIVQNP